MSEHRGLQVAGVPRPWLLLAQGDLSPADKEMCLKAHAILLQLVASWCLRFRGTRDMCLGYLVAGALGRKDKWRRVQGTPQH